MMTQKQMVIDYIKNFGSITPMEAFSDLGITKLATRVSELRRNGERIVKKMENGKNRFGRKIRYARYCFEQEE